MTARTDAPWTSWLLGALVAGGAAACTGCTTCKAHEVDSSASSALTYSESVASQRARVERMRTAYKDDAWVDADRTRGEARVVDEPRRFDDAFSATPSTLSLTSELKIKGAFAVQGIPIDIAVAGVTLALDRPDTAGTHALSALHARICEHGADPCSPAFGSIDFRPASATAFDADITLSAPPDADTADAVLRGTSHLHYEEDVSTDICPDVGGSGMFAG